MSAFMIHSFAFTNWVLRKFSHNNDGFDTHYVLSNLNHTLWDQFILTDEYASIVKPTVETIIPLLVENMPNKFNKKGNNSNTKSTDTLTVLQDDSNTDTKIVKKRGPKSKKNLEENTLQTSESTDIQEHTDTKIVKKRGPKSKKNLEENTMQTSESTDIQEHTDTKVAKKRGPKSKKNTETSSESTDIQVPNEINMDINMDEKPVKKRGPKSKKNTEMSSESTDIQVPNEIKDVQVDEKPVKKRGPKSKQNNTENSSDSTTETLKDNNGHKSKKNDEQLLTNNFCHDEIVIPEQEINNLAILPVCDYFIQESDEDEPYL